LITTSGEDGPGRASTRLAGTRGCSDELTMIRLTLTTLLGAALLFLPAAAHI
jgi:hypothetical protein